MKYHFHITTVHKYRFFVFCLYSSCVYLCTVVMWKWYFILVCISTYTAIKQNTKSCTYVGLYGSGLFNFRSYVNLPTLFACFLGFDVPTSSFIFIENVFIILVLIIMMKILPVLPLAGSLR